MLQLPAGSLKNSILHPHIRLLSGIIVIEQTIRLAWILQVAGAQMGRGAARLPEAALWPQLDLLVGDVLAAAAWLRSDGESGAGLCLTQVVLYTLIAQVHAQTSTTINT